jgi:tetraacyldisaccharide-1-P 4'-kinase
VTGTAQPHRILEALQTQKVALAACAHYPDHHPFSKADVDDWLAYGKTHGVRDLLTTTKDIVRLADHLGALKDWKVWILPAQVEWTQPDEVEAYLKSWLDSLPS